MLRRGVRAILAAAVAAAALGGCTGGGAAAAVGCAPAKSTSLVALGDPKGLVPPDAALPAISAKAGYRDLVVPLTQVSVALDQASFNRLTDQLGAGGAAQPLAAGFFAARRVTVARSRTGRVVVASTDEPIRRATAALYAEGLRRAGYTVTSTLLADDAAIAAALKAGTVQVAPQFTSGALAALRTPATGGSLQQAMLALGAAGRQSGIVYGVPARAGRQPVYAVSAEVARAHRLVSLADFAARCSGRGTVLAADATCAAAGGCADGLASRYGIRLGSVVPVRTGAAAREAVRSGTATLVAVAATDRALPR